MSKTSAKVLITLKYLCISVGFIAALDATILCLGYWLQVNIPVGIILGLNLGVIAYFAAKLHRS
jgi:hypothetical protein